MAESSPLQVTVEATDGPARATTISSARGVVRTPCFMPVGTRATVRAVDAVDLTDLGSQVVLANTYHLMLRPGADVVAEAGGLHRFMGLGGNGPPFVLTDSGGYQVFSLSPRVDDEGVTFRSTYDGSSHRLTPERAVEIQAQLGADIQMVLDVCPPLPSPPGVLRTAVERTADWAARARAVHLGFREAGGMQSLFGIVQGGVDPVLRAESAQRTVEIGFDGYGIGGLSVGESRDEMLPALAAALSVLPDDRPRYLMGVGDPLGIIESVVLGVDLFDSVLPTRWARHGTVLTAGGRLNLRNLVHQRSDDPLDPACACPVCARYSRAYLRHLLLVGEPTCWRLVTLHNLWWTHDLVAQLRRAIGEGTLDATARRLAEPWGGVEGG
jgi:queuine tRNA-ribosyltransferase